ncbi:hypothetical protein BGX38DRAFT_566940 [Terfezia claveryi]|nr:hypothetical protein BGX38DRAFT_566940 [Terfezia claveryi]
MVQEDVLRPDAIFFFLLMYNTLSSHVHHSNTTSLPTSFLIQVINSSADVVIVILSTNLTSPLILTSCFSTPPIIIPTTKFLWSVTRPPESPDADIGTSGRPSPIAIHSDVVTFIE